MVLRDPEHFNLIPRADQLSNATLQWLSPSQSQSLFPNSCFLGLHSLIKFEHITLCLIFCF